MTLRIPLTPDTTLRTTMEEIERRLRRLEKRTGVSASSGSTTVQIIGNSGGGLTINNLIQRIEALESAIEDVPHSAADLNILTFGAAGPSASEGLVPSPDVSAAPDGIAGSVLTEDATFEMPLRGLVQIVTPRTMDGSRTQPPYDVASLNAGLHVASALSVNDLTCSNLTIMGMTTGFSTNDVPSEQLIAYPYLWTDFPNFGGGQNIPFANGAIASGTLASVAGLTNHPGIVSLKSSTSANSGYYFITSTEGFIIAGGETFDLIFRPDALTDVTTYAGLIDTITTAAPTDGAFIKIPSTGALVGQTSNNTTTSTTASSYTVSTATWYRARMAVNTAATLVTFTLYSEAGSVLWTDTLSSNIPTAAGRETGCGLISTYSSAGTAQSLISADFMGLRFTKQLTR